MEALLIGAVALVVLIMIADLLRTGYRSWVGKNRKDERR